MEFGTRTIHARQPAEAETGAVVPPIFQTSTYRQISPGVDKGFSYSRSGNPTRLRLEQVLAELEGVSHGATFASGVSAANAVLQAYLCPGDEVLAPNDIYGGTRRLLNQVYQRWGITINHVDFLDFAALDQKLNKRTRILWIETPSNPRLIVYDIEAIAKRAHTHGAIVVVDNTFATPYFQQPFSLGADLVLHSATKYLCGHSDVIQGAVVARDVAALEPIRFLQNSTGAVPSPFDCWLTLRGIRTLELRMLRHAENASAIANMLKEHPLVAKVYFPGLPGHEGHAIARRQMSGFGGMVSFELDGTLEEVKHYVSSRRYFALGESLGGVESLVCHPATMMFGSALREVREERGIKDTLIRLSPGCENSRDLLDDLYLGLVEMENNRRKGSQVLGGLT
jgi:cystathionine beta-lyase/cystathionine gamma-synthase